MASSLDFIDQIFNDLFSTALLAAAVPPPPLCLCRGLGPLCSWRGCRRWRRNLAEGAALPPRTQPEPGPPLAPAQAQRVCSPAGSTDTAWGDAAAFPAVELRAHLLLGAAVLLLQAAPGSRVPELCPLLGDSPAAGPARPRYAAAGGEQRHLLRQPLPHSAKSPPMVGNEAFCPCWLWRLLDTNRQIAHCSGG